MVTHVGDRATSAADLDASIFDSAREAEESIVEQLVSSSGGENPYLIGGELGEEMTAACTVVKSEARLEQARDTLAGLRERYARISLSDTGLWTNQNLSYARALGDMLRIADAMIEASILRKESRGSHYRPDFPERNDEEFLRTTVASYDPGTDRPRIAYEEVEVGLVKPRLRNYATSHAPAKEEKDAKSEKVASSS